MISKARFDIDPLAPPAEETPVVQECDPAMLKQTTTKFVSTKAERVEMRAKGIAATDILTRQIGT